MRRAIKRKTDALRGLLYLTDQRLIMEAHEWQGGILGLGGKKVQRVAWEGPYTAIRDRERVPSRDEFGIHYDLILAEPAPAEELELLVRGLPAALAEARLRNAILSPPEQSRWPDTSKRAKRMNEARRLYDTLGAGTFERMIVSILSEGGG